GTWRKSATRRPRPCAPLPRTALYRAASGRRRSKRQADDELAAEVLAGAARRHRAAVRLDELVDDGEADAEARLVDRNPGVDREQVEDVRQLLGSDADAVVGDGDDDLVGAAPRLEQDVAARVRSPRGVVDQVGEDLGQPLRVAEDGGGGGVELDAQTLLLLVDRVPA